MREGERKREREREGEGKIEGTERPVSEREQ